MSFGKKIFIMSFIIVVLSIYIIGFCILSNNYKISLQEQIDKSIFQINTIKNNVMFYENEKGISALANQYLQDKIHIEVSLQGKLIYSNITKDITDMKEKVKVGEEWDTYIYIEQETLYTGLKKDDIEIMTTTDIGEINENRKEQVTFFIKLAIFFSILIAFLLSMLVGLLTKKIKKLNYMATEIEKGNYEITVPKLGTDEVGNLGRTFNNMMISIKNNIAHLNKVAQDRKDFINNLTHEIRTPLTSIVGYSSLIKNGKVKEKEKLQEYASKIYKEGIYIKELTDKLMEITLLEEQEQGLENINISESMEEIAKELQEKFETVSIETEITPNVYAKVDSILLQLLISNLVKNAINAYEIEPIVVKIVLEKDTIKVIDFGKGIQENIQEKILQPFYTERKDRNREFSGMGLGLPLCLKITKIFKWKFEIKSEINKGTEIILEIGEENETIENSDTDF